MPNKKKKPALKAGKQLSPVKPLKWSRENGSVAS